MTLGGGGYTLRNVARCWANETAIIVDQDDVISPTIPETSEYREFFAAEQFKLKPELARKWENQNTKEYLELLRQETVENLRGLKHAPSVQMQPEQHFEESFIDFMRNPKKLKGKKNKKDPPRDG
uniref:Histone deacetylase n=1 Tax=Panagrellus redivivus TaxID=6233 RepID=A0A7E4WE36_PANRE